MLLLEQDITKKGQVDKTTIKLDEGDSKEYKVKAICDSAFYASKLEGHLSGLYYLLLWKCYLEKKST